MFRSQVIDYAWVRLLHNAANCGSEIDVHKVIKRKHLVINEAWYWLKNES